VALVNRALARRYFGDRSPLGQAVGFRELEGERIVERTVEVVGVVEDTVYRDLHAPVPPTLYRAFSQEGHPAGAYLFVRAARGSAAAIARGVVSAVATLDPTLSLSVRTLSEQVDANLARDRLVAMLAGFFGVLALLLAGIGVYGITAYGVHRRRTELGLRMALGAAPAGVLRLVLRRVAMLTGLGVAAGGAASFWAVRFAGSLLYGLEPRDPSTFVAAAAVLALVGLLAGAIPAWRAARVDPSVVLRRG
jgi:predicted lysophospholipase L1 biosynthesis ABC-type transport system permease subunit